MHQARDVTVAAGIIVDGGRILVARRPPSLHCGNLWEFPGGKLEPGESAEQALVRELREELRVKARVSAPYRTVSHRYPDRRITLHFLFATILSGEPQAHGCVEVRWVSPTELTRLEFPPADEKVVAELVRRHERGESLQGPHSNTD